jgi:hypothetical protein
VTHFVFLILHSNSYLGFVFQFGLRSFLFVIFWLLAYDEVYTFSYSGRLIFTIGAQRTAAATSTSVLPVNISAETIEAAIKNVNIVLSQLEHVVRLLNLIVALQDVRYPICIPAVVITLETTR